MQLTPNLKPPLLLLGFIGFTAGILWSVYSGDTSNERKKVDPPATELEKVAESNNGPFWQKYMPKSSVEKRDALRTTRQNELAQMIEELKGVKKASVVLSDDSKQGIGQPHRQMSACVMVEPISGPITIATLGAIRTIVSDATSGLETENIHVINSTLGVVSVGVPSLEETKFSPKEIRTAVKNAIGLSIAVVTVQMQRNNSMTEFIPWIDDATPKVRVSLPQSWIDRRSQQVGGEEIALQAITDLVHEAVSDAEIEIISVQDNPAVSLQPATNASYAKHIFLLAGLGAVLVSSFATDRRRRKAEVVFNRIDGTPLEEAEKILQMDYSLAKSVIDSLEGTRRIEVLHAIVSSEEATQEVPVVEVVKGKQLELTKCG